MANLGKSMSIASRLAAATALTGSLAACDTWTSAEGEPLVAPLTNVLAPSPDAVQLAQRSQPSALPGNPVPLGGSQAANDALYQQTYGAPVQGSGQAILPQMTSAPSVYQDSTITAMPITDIPGGPVIDAGASSLPAPVYTPQPIAYAEPVQIQSQPVYSAPVSTVAPAYVPQTSGSFPALSTEPSYLPQSTLPISNAVPTQAFSDASAQGSRDIEPLLSAAPQQQSVPYGSSASHRYSVAVEPLPMQTEYAALPEYLPQQYSLPVETIAADPISTAFPAPVPAEPVGVEVAALGGAYVPMPRARPALIRPVVKKKVVAAALPPVKAAPVDKSIASSPMPKLRPVQIAALSGKAITDAPPLTELPQMIEVEPIFLDDLDAMADVTTTDVPTSGEMTASLTPVEVPEEPASVDAGLEVIKPEDLEREMATLGTTDADSRQAEDVEMASLGSDETVMAEPAEKLSENPRLEIADDVGDLKELSGTSWRLASLDGKDVPESAELHFDGTSGFAGGQGICNNYGGEFSETLKGDFDMGNIFSTETECENIDLEKRYIVALESASKYRMAPGLKELMLLGPDGKTVATFAAF